MSFRNKMHLHFHFSDPLRLAFNHATTATRRTMINTPVIVRCTMETVLHVCFVFTINCAIFSSLFFCFWSVEISFIYSVKCYVYMSVCNLVDGTRMHWTCITMLVTTRWNYGFLTPCHESHSTISRLVYGQIVKYS